MADEAMWNIIRNIVIVGVVFGVILYYIIENAVRNGVDQALRKYFKPLGQKPESKPTEEQKKT